jgi:hypothetical protein
MSENTSRKVGKHAPQGEQCAFSAAPLWPFCLLLFASLWTFEGRVNRSTQRRDTHELANALRSINEAIETAEHDAIPTFRLRIERELLLMAGKPLDFTRLIPIAEEELAYYKTKNDTIGKLVVRSVRS